MFDRFLEERRILLLDDNNESEHRRYEVAKLMMADAVENNQLRRRYIKKFLGRAEAEELLRKVHAINEDSERRLN